MRATLSITQASMDRYLPVAGIRLNDCLFTEPMPLVGWNPPQFAGISAIFVHDPNWAPKPFQPLYFGEYGNNAPLSAWLTNYHELLHAAQGKELLVSVCPMPFSTTTQRRSVRDELIWAYNPISQPVHMRLPASQAPRHSTETERQRHENEAQLAAMLADTNAAQRKSARRRIGFMPECEPAR
jgi:hypothetical protein